MTTITKTRRVTYTVHTRKVTVASASGFWAALEDARLAILPVILVVTGCLGGIAVGFGVHDSDFELAIVAVGTLIPLSLLLAMVPMKPVFYSSVIAVVLDLLVFII